MEGLLRSNYFSGIFFSNEFFVFMTFLIFNDEIVSNFPIQNKSGIFLGVYFEKTTQDNFQIRAGGRKLNPFLTKLKNSSKYVGGGFPNNKLHDFNH